MMKNNADMKLDSDNEVDFPPMPTPGIPTVDPTPAVSFNSAMPIASLRPPDSSAIGPITDTAPNAIPTATKDGPGVGGHDDMDDGGNDSGSDDGSNDGDDANDGKTGNGGSNGGGSGSSDKSSSGNNSNNNSGNFNFSGNNNDSSNKSNRPTFNNSDTFDPDPSCQMVNENDGRLQYTGAWTLESRDPNGLSFTSHTTSTAGSQVSMIFNGPWIACDLRSTLTSSSPGTSVTVIGVVHASNDTYPPATAAYTIDSYPPISLPLPFTSRDIPNQAFFESEVLPLGAHKLTINVTSDGSPYTLNSLKICSKDTNPVAAALSPSVKPSPGANVPVIVGAVVGTVVVLGLAVLGSVLLFRRRRQGKTPAASIPMKMGNRVLSWLQRRMSQPRFPFSVSVLTAR